MTLEPGSHLDAFFARPLWILIESRFVLQKSLKASRWCLSLVNTLSRPAVGDAGQLAHHVQRRCLSCQNSMVEQSTPSVEHGLVHTSALDHGACPVALAACTDHTFLTAVMCVRAAFLYIRAVRTARPLAT